MGWLEAHKWVVLAALGVVIVAIAAIVVLPNLRSYTGYRVVGQEIDTKVDVHAGQDIHITASGTVNFGGGVLGIDSPVLDADGDSSLTPVDYPAPALRKNSLIARVGSQWYQAGTDKQFWPLGAGRLYLRTNDKVTEDNSGGWYVHVELGSSSPDGGTTGGTYFIYDFGPVTVVAQPIPTVEVQAGSAVHITASGLVDFGGAVLGVAPPILDANGDGWPTPDNYPAPSLRKNSLIAKVGRLWYQGGTDRTFTPAESGAMTLEPNDGQPDDNSRGWAVTVHITPPPPAPSVQPTPGNITYGPFAVSNSQVNTAVNATRGQHIHITAGGLINFGGGIGGVGNPILGPDGDKWATPSNYPAPNLHKNSLIVKVGSLWYQGGSDVTIVPSEAGMILLEPNDGYLADNTLGWQVMVTVS